MFLLTLASCALRGSDANVITGMVQDCYADRKKEKTIEKEAAIVIKWQEFYLLSSDDGTQKWQPCEVPASFRKQGLKVYFSGDEMSVFPGERRAATPLHLSAIELRN